MMCRFLYVSVVVVVLSFGFIIGCLCAVVFAMVLFKCGFCIVAINCCGRLLVSFSKFYVCFDFATAVPESPG